MNPLRIASFVLLALAFVVAALWLEPWVHEPAATTTTTKTERPDDPPIAHAETRPIERDSVIVASEPDTTNELPSTSAGWFGVRVERDGVPSVGAVVRIGRLTRKSDDRGIVEFTRSEVLDEPEVLLRGEILCVAGAGNASARRTVPIGPAKIRMQLKEGEGSFVRGEVLDARERPVAGALVRFGVGTGEREHIATTDEKGAFAFEALLAESAALSVELDGVVRDQRFVAVPSRPRIVLSDPTSLEIVVHGNVAGEAVEIALVAFDSAGNGFVTWRAASKEASPTFRSNALPASIAFAVCAAADGFAPIYREVTTSPPQPMTILLERKDALRLHLPGCAGRSVIVNASSDLELESVTRTRNQFTLTERVELDAAGTATLKRVARDRGVRFHASVPIESGTPRREDFLGGVLDPQQTREFTYPEIVLHRIRIHDPSRPLPFVLAFEFGPPAQVRLPPPLAYSKGYGVLGSHFLATNDRGEIVLDWPLGKTVTAELLVPGQRTRAVEFEVTGTGDVALRQATSR